MGTALVQCLQALADRDLNLSKLESRPRRGTPFEYLFYIDFEGNVADARVKEAIAELRQRASHLKMLGSYAVASAP